MCYVQFKKEIDDEDPLEKIEKSFDLCTKMKRLTKWSRMMSRSIPNNHQEDQGDDNTLFDRIQLKNLQYCNHKLLWGALEEGIHHLINKMNEIPNLEDTRNEHDRIGRVQEFLKDFDVDIFPFDELPWQELSLPVFFEKNVQFLASRFSTQEFLFFPTKERIKILSILMKMFGKQEKSLKLFLVAAKGFWLFDV